MSSDERPTNMVVRVCYSSQDGAVDNDQMTSEEFYVSLRKTAADIEMLNNFD